MLFLPCFFSEEEVSSPNNTNPEDVQKSSLCAAGVGVLSAGGSLPGFCAHG